MPNAAVSKACLVRFDHNKYSVDASAVGRPVEVHAYADRIDLRQDGRLVGRHPRCFGRGATVCDPWRYVPVLARKPGALHNGAPFKHWVPPRAIEKVRTRLRGVADGDRQMVEILAAAMTDGLAAVEAACAEALENGEHSADVVINTLARRRDPEPPAPIPTPETLRLRLARLSPTAPGSRQPQEHLLMERSETLAAMAELKLNGVRAAYDDVIAAAVKRQYEPQKIAAELLAAEFAESEAE